VNVIDDCQDRLHRAGWSVAERQITTKQGDAWEVTCARGGREIQVTAPTRAETWELACSQAAKPARMLRTQKPSLASKVFFAIALIVVAVPFLCCGNVVYHNIVNGCPSAGRVRVHVEHLPPDTTFCSVASEGDEGLRSMHWYSTNGLVTTEIHPSDHFLSYIDPDTANPMLPSCVVWRKGQRYGIVTRDITNVWRITWFGPDVRQLGGANFNLAQGVAVPLTPQQVKELGLDKVKPYSN
jgi:hypothetical protein